MKPPIETIPYGTCHCGCGQKTNIAATTRKNRAWIKGQPKKFITKHNSKNIKPFLGMDSIPLTQGMIAKISPEDYRLVSNYSWCLHSHGYAMARISGEAVFLHRMIMGYPAFQIDHISGDKLDNRRENLRLCNQAQNSQNSWRVGATGYKGVWKQKNRWSSIIKVNGVRKFLGSWITPELAAEAYDAAAINYFGEFARTNKKMGLL